ncbi:DUF5753 domain-containing protein [Nocardiopsis exhalans]|uniref:DUF5753 domain-containing protein n=1 Tax=Nocardiopsis exhalans TaxID=163604 RepID=A0ABY5D4A9_9ACTN|nr:Scr1 family TA system antitoxin-like transcriptional regulator [Nocardiopsis exhalans]USY18039.1 DUF5753 domain-containing protein [Nocardiopsis exhalans]
MPTTEIAAELIYRQGQEGLLIQEAEHATWQYMPLGIPGLLQNPDYARAVHTQLPHLGEASQEQVRLRMQRAEQMRALPHLYHRFVLGSVTLAHPTPVMRAQLAHLQELDQLPHIEIRVLPAGPVITDPSGFTLRADQVWIEAADLYFTAPGHRALWHAEWDRLWSKSAPLNAAEVFS